VRGIGLVDGQAVAHQDVGQALHPLAGKVHPPGDLGHRRRLVLDRLQDQPAGQRLAGRPGQRLPGDGEVPDEPDHLHEEIGQGVPGRRALRGPIIDNMLSSW
jgi:hypothetical protein